MFRSLPNFSFNLQKLCDGTPNDSLRSALGRRSPATKSRCTSLSPRRKNLTRASDGPVETRPFPIDTRLAEFGQPRWCSPVLWITAAGKDLSFLANPCYQSSDRSLGHNPRVCLCGTGAPRGSPSPAMKIGVRTKSASAKRLSLISESRFAGTAGIRV